MSESDSLKTLDIGALDMAARHKRVQDLCRQLTALVRFSLDKRRAIEHLVRELETIASRMPERLRVRTAGAGIGRRLHPAAECTPPPHGPHRSSRER